MRKKPKSQNWGPLGPGEFETRVEFIPWEKGHVRGASEKTQTIADIAATCANCGLVYPSQLDLNLGGPGIEVLAVEFRGTPPWLRRCPRCGGQGVMGELYGVLKEGVLQMTSSGATFEQVADVIQILRAAAEREETSVATVVDEIKAKAPEQTGLIDYLNKVAPAGGMLASFLAILVSVLIAIYGSQPAPQVTVMSPPAPQVTVTVEPPSAEQIDRAVRKVLAEQEKQKATTTPPKTRTEKNRQKRERKRRRR